MKSMDLMDTQRVKGYNGRKVSAINWKKAKNKYCSQLNVRKYYLMIEKARKTVIIKL